jgi:hypothetical protein
MNRVRTLVGTLSTLPLTLAVACQSSEPPSLEGLWQTEGYGLLVEVADSTVGLTEITAVSCMPREDELQRAGVEADGSWQLRRGNDPAGAHLFLESADRARLQPAGTASSIYLRRISRRPDVCDRVQDNTPEAVFDVFWATYAEHYPFFDMKGVDWMAVRDEMRPLLTDSTPPDELFDLLVDAIRPLHDTHTSLSDEESGRREMFMRPDPELADVESVGEALNMLGQRFERAVEIVETRYIQGNLRSFCNGHLRYGELPGDIAYIWLDQEGGYTNQPGFAAQLGTMEAALDTIFTAAEDARGVILDVRKNFGGSDILSLAMASRLATSRYVAYAKVARLDPQDPQIFTEPQERVVPTTTRPGFRGPVVELIGRYTISAGETLTQALLGREPHITRIGEHTQGVFSDVQGRSLPNGWSFGLPNELFLTEDGRSFDGTGIPPDIEVPVFRPADLEAGLDPALEAALAHIGAPEG